MDTATTQARPVATQQDGGRFGAGVALATAVAGLVALPVAVTTPPRAGPFCRSGCLAYPYADAAAFVPRDYLWMYPALVLLALFLVLTVAVHESTPPQRRALSGACVAFTAVATAVLATDYGTQLTVMQPSLAKGESAALAAFSQYNPHGVFIALENVGYVALAVAFVFAGLAARGRSALDRALAGVFLGGGALTLLALVVLAVAYRSELDYRFEVAAISLCWLVLIATGVLLHRRFARAVLP